jgi:hypothetical protein
MGTPWTESAKRHGDTGCTGYWITSLNRTSRFRLPVGGILRS